MHTTESLQKIIDHFHIGKIIAHQNLLYYYEIKTNQGMFYLLFDKVVTARETESQRLGKVLNITNKKVTRLLLKNYNGEYTPENSYTHSKETYYSLYKINK